MTHKRIQIDFTTDGTPTLPMDAWWAMLDEVTMVVLKHTAQYCEQVQIQQVHPDIDGANFDQLKG